MVVRMAVYTECRANRMIPSETPFTTINSRRVENNPMDHDPLPSLSLSSHLAILSQLIRELFILFFQSQLEAPVSSNHQEPGRLQDTGRKEEKGNCRERRERRKDTDRGGREGLTEFSQHW